MKQTALALLASLFLATLSSASAQTFTNLLSDGNMSQWEKLNGEPVTEGWEVDDDGVLQLSGKGGNIVTREQFGDFELWFEFRISPKGNSGIKYRVKQYEKQWLGLEYQVLDDAAYPQLGRDHLTGSLYDLVDPIPLETRLKDGNEFNVGKIRVSHGRTQHWVNGQLLIDERLYGVDWRSHVAASKFKDRERFGENALGKIMLTDHNSPVAYRNVFIRRLSGTTCQQDSSIPCQNPICP